MQGSSLGQYTDFLETLPDAALLVKADGTIAFANRLVGELLGYSHDELVGRPVNELVPVRYRDRCHALVTGCLAGRRTHRLGDRHAFWGLRCDGRAIALDVTLAPLTMAGPTHVVCVLRDAGAQQRSRTLASLDTALRMASTRADLVDILCEEVQETTGAAGTCFITDLPDDDESLVEAAYGMFAPWRGERVSAADSLSDLVSGGSDLFVTNAATSCRQATLWNLGEDVPALALVPVRAGAEEFGVLGLARGMAFDGDEAETLRAVACVAAATFQRLALYEARVRDTALIADACEDLLSTWARALDMRERAPEGHSRRVTDLTLSLARALHVDPERFPDLRRGALLHDVGKALVPDAILHKAGVLDDTERAVLRQHPSYAYDLLGTSDMLRQALEIPYFHHERWDGGGYPRGLKGEEIPLAARIFAVADVFEAMTHDRPYRLGLSSEEALRYIVQASGSHFDPRVVDALVSLGVGEPPRVRPARG